MSDSKEFIWTDELVAEYLSEILHGKLGFEYNHLEKFKKSKIPVPEYEILSFKGDIKVFGEDKFFNLIGDGVYLDVKCNMPNSLNSLLNEGFSVKTGQVSIYSVKRISDGEVFSIGDVIELFGDYPTGSIDKFMIDTFDTTRISAYNNCGYGKGISHLKKVKPKLPLFEDEMGNKIFEFEKWWIIDTEIEYLHLREVGTYDKNAYGIKRFKNKSDAENWLLENTPIQVTYKEITDLLNPYFARPVTNNTALKEFFQSKINP